MLRILSKISPTGLVFLSGLSTSLAANLITGQTFDQGNVVLPMVGLTGRAAIEDLLALDLFILGSAVFWLASIRESAGGRADFIRGDYSNEVEYREAILEFLSREKTILSVLTLVICLSVVVASFALWYLRHG